MNNPDKNKDNSTTQLTIEDKDTHKAAANFDIPSAAPITVIPSPIGTNKVASIICFLFLFS